MIHIDTPQTILLTGATGLLGSRLCLDLVRKGYQLRALVRKSGKTIWVEKQFRQAFGENWKAEWDRIDWVEGDILELTGLEQAMKGVDQVVHAAALVSFHPKDVKTMWKVNIEGTANVVNVALEGGVKHLVHVSSVAALGRSENTDFVNEKTDWKNDPEHSNYARTKYMAEQEVWRGMAEGLNASAVNPGVIVGPGNPKRSTAEVFGIVKKGLKYYTSGSAGCVDVRDVSKAIVDLLAAPKSGERFILVGEHASNHDLLSKIASEQGVKAPYHEVSKSSAKWLARLLWLREKVTGLRAFITAESVEMAFSNYSYDNSKSKLVLGMEYRSLDEAISFAVSEA